ncbi:MAG: glycosyltransferase family 4 protein [Prevotella sp.]|nr:glycosyltransferase family 4 protein [Prevotella sp.]
MGKTVIGMDAKRIVRNGTGLGSYGRTLVAGLSGLDQFSLRLYAPDLGHEWLRSQVQGLPGVELCLPHRAAGAIGKALWRSHGVVKQLQADGVQVFHGLTGELPIGIRKAGIASVVTIHDLIFMRHPEYYNWADTKIYAWKFRRTLMEADRIVAISECTKRDIVELGGVDPSYIKVVYQSCAPRFDKPVDSSVCQEVARRYGLPRRFMLCVGTIEQRKNLLLALRALRWMPADVALVAIGRPTPYTAQLQTYAEREGLAQRLLMLHGIGDDELPAFYALADVFVYPSRYEGFGIPIIEAISSGLPVVACTGSCLEEAGGPHSLYTGPDDDRAFAAAACQLLRGAEGRQERIDRSRDYIGRFQGTSVAAQMADIYQEVSGER